MTQPTEEKKKQPVTVTTHDIVTARLSQPWVDPAEKLRQEERARKHLRLFRLKEQVAEMQQEIADLEAELSTPLN